MSSIPRHRRPRNKLIASALLAAAAIAVTPQESRSCGGGYYEPSIINSKESLMTIPSARFFKEISRIKLPVTPFKCVTGESTKTMDGDTALYLQDVEAFLKANGVPEAQRSELGQNALTVRHFGMQYAAELEAWDNRAANSSMVRPSPVRPALNVNLPDELSIYLDGWSAFQIGQPEQARTAWQKILDRPADQRQWRGVWAAYMMGRSFQKEDPSKAIDWFIKTRDLAKAGGKDTLGLAAASYGWQARAELDLKHFDRAIDLYLLQYATGDGSAVPSLQLTSIAAIESGPETLKSLAKIDSSRAVLTAFVVSLGGPWQKAPSADKVRAWLDAVEQANVPKLQGAERCAWSAYEYGHYDLAARWVAKADANDPMAQWVASKLALRAGRTDEAIKLLASAAAAFPAEVEASENDGEMNYRITPVVERVRGELGALRLARSQYAESLDLLLKGKYWTDAAYIAERVLTADELRAYVDKFANKPTNENFSAIRSLLARRLLRLGRWKDARPYFTTQHQKTMDEYIAAIRSGHDDKLVAHDRAAFLWQAAQIARDHGMELLGTELGPDANIYDGNSEETSLIKSRLAEDDPLLKPTADEVQRLKRPPEQLEKRFQYRYVAADHAWAAAQLLADNTPELADVLNQAGTWLKNRDPSAADRFYKALVKRCPNTDIGKKAIEKKWFAPVKS